jgi:hypothetical protein
MEHAMIDLMQADATLRQNEKPSFEYGVYLSTGKLIRVFSNQSSAMRFLFTLIDEHAFIKPIH